MRQSHRHYSPLVESQDMVSGYEYNLKAQVLMVGCSVICVGCIYVTTPAPYSNILFNILKVLYPDRRRRPKDLFSPNDSVQGAIWLGKKTEKLCLSTLSLISGPRLLCLRLSHPPWPGDRLRASDTPRLLGAKKSTGPTFILSHGFGAVRIFWTRRCCCCMIYCDNADP